MEATAQPAKPAPPAPPGTGRPRANPYRLFALVSVALAVLIVYLLPDGLFLSSNYTDLTGQFAAWRAFAADSIHAGHFPLWNPYTYAGQPFLGDFQSAELYPLNVVFLFLPLERAMNLSFLLHLLILGWGMGFWARRRGYHPAACVLCGVAIAFCGPVYLRLYAGHITFLCTMAWAPWMFAALEAAWRGPVLRPLLLAAGAICLQILGGGEQYMFYVAIAAAMHALVQSVVEPSVCRRAVPVLIAAYLGGCLLSAAQLLPGLAAVSESVRQGKLDFDFVSIFPFPPENLLTVFAPNFFGKLSDSSYWGRAYLWEASLFIGASGLSLAGLALGDREHRRKAWADFVLAPPLFLLALGSQTPLLQILYDSFPGFGNFRVLAKFAFPLMLFVVLVIGAGADALVRGRLGSRFYALAVLATGVVALAAGVFLLWQPDNLAGLFHFIQNTHKSYVPPERFNDADFLRQCGRQAGRALMIPGGIFLLIGASLLCARQHPLWRRLPLAILPLEMLFFAWMNLGIAHTSDLVAEPLRNYVASHPGDYRVLNLAWANNGYFFGETDLWGNDPTVLKRYAQFIAFTQGNDPDRATQEADFHSVPAIYGILRFRIMFLPHTHSYQMVDLPGALPHVLLIPNYKILPNRDAIFSELAKSDFDPHQTVFLESPPNPRPQPDAPPGTVKLTDSTSDSLTIVADTPAPAILLITDLYSRDWYARPLAGSVQTHYDVMPGDYILRAIPLAAGHHHLVVEYDPPSFRQGLIVSGLAWLGWVLLMIKWRSNQTVAMVV